MSEFGITSDDITQLESLLEDNRNQQYDRSPTLADPERIAADIETCYVGSGQAETGVRHVPSTLPVPELHEDRESMCATSLSSGRRWLAYGTGETTGRAWCRKCRREYYRQDGL